MSYPNKKKEDNVVCPHCHTIIDTNPIPQGFTTLCPYCSKPYGLM